jgi:hypothetical protein
MLRILDRAVSWLIECEYLEKWWHTGTGDRIDVFFRERQAAKRGATSQRASNSSRQSPFVGETQALEEDSLRKWISTQREDELLSHEAEALDSGFGKELVRNIALDERQKGTPLLRSSRIRQDFVRQFVESLAAKGRMGA